DSEFRHAEHCRPRARSACTVFLLRSGGPPWIGGLPSFVNLALAALQRSLAIPPVDFDSGRSVWYDGDMTRPLNVHSCKLMGPGPSDVDPRVLAAIATPTIGHLDPQFLGILNDIREMLQAVFQTRNELTLAVSGTGSAGMEACIVNLIEPGD